jgi:uncharacterized protein YdbL (DUF1318 family)
LCTNSRLAFACLLALTVWIGLSSGTEAKGYMTNEFRTALDRPLKLVLLPPHADFIKAKTVMTEEMVAESHALEDAAAKAIVQDLQAMGYDILYLSPSDLQNDPELADLVTEVNERYDAEWVQIVQKPKKVRKRRYSIGEGAVALGSALDVDGLLISRIQAVGVTAGKQALQATMAVLFGAGGQTSYGRLDLAVVDADDGDIHGYFYFAASCSLKQLTNKPNAAMKKAAKGALKKHPESDEVLEARKEKKLGVEEDEEEASDDIVSEFEALLAEKAGTAEEETETQEQSTPEKKKE